jgi:8-oxo-dGTP pyrophosphatase MutT (NUDIX family)
MEKGNMKDAIAVVIKRNEKYLLIKRAKKGFAEDYWCPITGEVEKGETQKHAVIREAKEEMGLEVEPVRKVWECPTADGQYILHWWEARMIEENVKVNSDEVKESKWVDVDEMQNIGKMFNADIKFFKDIAKDLSECK